jgi:MoaA/NifB/PqqE/SkfB family radical SAM enzyme
MCDIWKDNKNLKQLTEHDVRGLLDSLKQFGTRQVVMSGGEALLNQNFFGLCQILKNAGIKVSLLTTGLSVKAHADQLLKYVNDIIVSLDGDQPLHDAIRNIPGAFQKLKDGVEHIRSKNPKYRITARTVIHRLNFWNWSSIIYQARQMGIDQVSFLPADISSHAFNRQTAWSEPKQDEILLSKNELPELQSVVDHIITKYTADFSARYIAESALRIQDIYNYYAAFYELNPFPYKKCNAPWVSTVVEADGSVRPCFFHEVIGNIRDNSLAEIVNSDETIKFRKTLDMGTNPTCVKCVCTLNLSPTAKL